jgi:Ca2+-binding RTX toxin-like protein
MSGLVKRRFAESEFFGLYNDANHVSADEAKQVYRMFTKHRSDIANKEALYGFAFDGTPGTVLINGKSVLQEANDSYTAIRTAYLTDGRINTLEENLNQARDALFTYLQATYQATFLGLSASNFRSLDIRIDPAQTPNHGAFLSGVIIGQDGNEFATRNIILGEDGDDELIGGKGDDVLLGGTGFDTYYYRIGDGNDRIYDDDKQGRIIVVDETGSVKETRALGNFYKSGENIWKLPDGSTITITQNSPTTVVLPDGGTIDLGDNFQDGDFGIHLLDVPDSPQTNNTIVGDLSPLDFDPDAEGIQSRIDEWGNVITDPGNPDPNKEDILYDTTGNDRIEGKGGDDYIEAKRGGDEWLLGGDGSDIINSWNRTGTDIIEGGADSDIIYAGAGDDKVFTEDYGEMETLIADGETATSINEQGDLISGGLGNDFVYGANTNDALLGGITKRQRFGREVFSCVGN